VIVTDLYELTMAESYLRRGMSEPATFSLFVRRLPPGRDFLVAAGLDDCLTFLEGFHFAAEDLDWLRAHGFDADRFASLRFTGDVWAVPEGRVVLAGEPLLEVTAPIAEAQVVETALLNHVTYQTALATKAVRYRQAAGPILLADFALRRAHGVEAGMAVSRAAAVAGFAATSNVAAAQRYGLPVTGTMAHSYVQAFPTELEAFRAFATDHPDRVTFLIDTYDVDRGLQNAIAVIRERGLQQTASVRIDSGDLVARARHARRHLDGAGLGAVRIFVSGGIDEDDLVRFVHEQAPIDAAGVGTDLGIAEGAPTLESAYKLTEYAGRPVCKLSEEKRSLPGAKQVWRRAGHADTLGLRSEAGPDGAEPLLRPVMVRGRRSAPQFSLDAAREQLARDLLQVPAGVTHSARLQELADTVAAEVDSCTTPQPR